MSTVLLIDDDERLGEVLLEYGERFGPAITAATRPSAGLEALAGQRRRRPGDRADRDGVRAADPARGRAPRHLEAVLEPLHRLDPSRPRSSGGIGLGRSPARLVAEAHGGTLRVASDPAREPGTRVVVTLPRTVPGTDIGYGYPVSAPILIR